MAKPTSQSVQIRAYQFDDRERLAALLNNPRVSETTASVPYPYSQADADAFLGSVVTEEGRKVSRAIILEDVGLVGGIGLGIRANGEEELGYWIGEPYWGQGIASVAVAQFLSLLDELGIEGPIAAQTNVGNDASQKVLIKNGFRYDGEGECVTPARECSRMPSKRFILER